MTPSSTLATWLYGSHARGDADELSDVDVLMVSNSWDDAIEVDCLCMTGSEPSVARYTWAEIDGMAECGSLFLRHLQMEGQPIIEAPLVKGRLSSTLSRLRPYKMAGRDVHGFEEVVNDVRRSLAFGGSIIFELATLGTLIRHACILGCAIAGNPCFSRLEPVKRLSENWEGAANWAGDFESLYRYRLYADGRLRECSRPSVEFASTWCGRAEALLTELRRRVDEAH